MENNKLREAADRMEQDHIQQMINSHIAMVQDDGGRVRGSVGTRMRCPTCGVLRWNDGTPCAYCRKRIDQDVEEDTLP